MLLKWLSVSSWSLVQLCLQFGDHSLLLICLLYTSILDLIAFADNRIFLSAKDVLYDSCGKVQKPRQLTYSEMRQFLEIAITQAPDTELLRILASEIRDQLLFRLAETPEDSTEIDPLLEYIDSQFL